MKVFDIRVILEILLKIWDVVQEMAGGATIVILLVLICRLFIRKVSKKACYFLWTIVALRLLCPVMLPSQFSIFNTFENKNVVKLENEASPIIQLQTLDEFNDSNMLKGNGIIEEGVVSEVELSEVNKQPISPGIGTVNMGSDSDTAENLAGIGSAANVINITLPFLLWLIGMCIMFVYGIVSYWHLKRKLRFATKIQEDVFESESIASPFVFGVLKPVIYLPLQLEEKEREYVLAHERYHIKRKDYIIKLAAYGLLSVYWFYPLVWISFYMMSRDMEMSCDEQVIKSLELEERKAYSTLLLSFASGKRFPLPSPLAFGENDVKSRIRQILNYKSPTLWGILAAIFLVVVVAVCCLTDAKNDNGESLLTEHLGEMDFLTDKDVKQLSEKLFERKTPYIGDIVANGKVLNAVFEPLGITGWNGSELQTREEPYWISLTFDNKPDDGKMWQASAMFLALVENANEVRWSFYNEDGAYTTYYVTVDSINERLNDVDIKAYSDSEEKIAELWTLLKETRENYEKKSNKNEQNVLVGMTSWDGLAIEAGLDFTERIEWENRLNTDDINYRGNEGVMRHCFYQDFDKNGMMDLIIVIYNMNWDNDAENVFSLGIYMNDDPLYTQVLPMYCWDMEIISGDIDHDGYMELVYSGHNGGNGGAGGYVKGILKYKNNTFTEMELLGDFTEEEREYGEAGYHINVLFGKETDTYEVICPALNESKIIQAEYSKTEDGSYVVKPRSGAVAGANCRGFYNLRIINENGVDYLMADEYFYKEGGVNDGLGNARFIFDWNNKEGWFVKDYQVYSFSHINSNDENTFESMKYELEYYPAKYEELRKNWSNIPVINLTDGSVYEPYDRFTQFAYTSGRNMSSGSIIYAKLNEKEELTYVYINFKDGKYYYLEDYSRCSDKPYYIYKGDYFQKVYTDELHCARKYSDGNIFEHFYLTNEESLTEKDIFYKMLSSKFSPGPDVISVYMKKLDEEGLKEYTRYTGDFVEQGIKITMPENSSWIGDPQYELVNEVAYGTYHDYHINAEMTILAGVQENVFKQAGTELEEKLTPNDYETWSAKTRDGKYVEIALYVEASDTPDRSMVAAKWEYDGNTYLLYGNMDGTDCSSVAKTAIHIIEYFEK